MAVGSFDIVDYTRGYRVLLLLKLNLMARQDWNFIWEVGDVFLVALGTGAVRTKHIGAIASGV